MAFIQTSGTRFTLGGQIWRPYGASIYGSTDTTAHMAARVDDAVSMNFNALRIVNYFNGATYTTEANWARVDYLLDYAAQKGIKIFLDCSDYCGYLVNTALITPANQDWTAFVNFLLNRVNTINGKTYKNDDAIAVIIIAGEISSYDSELPTFYGNVSTLFKNGGAQQLIASGGIEYYNSTIQQVFALSTIDCVGSHSYEQNVGYNGQTEYNMSIHQQYATQYSKPWYLEEFGHTTSLQDFGMGNYMMLQYKRGLKYTAAGFLYWNLYPSPVVGGVDYNIGPGGGMPYTNNIVKLYSYIKDYSPRISIFVVQAAGLGSLRSVVSNRTKVTSRTMASNRQLAV